MLWRTQDPTKNSFLKISTCTSLTGLNDNIMFHKSPPTPEVHLRPLRPALGAGGGAAAAGHGGHRAAGLLPLLQVRPGHEDLELRRGLRGLAPGPPLLGAGECEGGARGADHQHVDGGGPGDVSPTTVGCM